MSQNLLERYQRTMTNMFGTPARALVKGKGVYVWDADGKCYKDFLAGIAVNALSHAHLDVVEALRQQVMILVITAHLFNLTPTSYVVERYTRHAPLDYVST